MADPITVINDPATYNANYSASSAVLGFLMQAVTNISLNTEVKEECKEILQLVLKDVFIPAE